uniref:DnaJ homolog subfamily C member 22 n=1 Tax=Gasterosteus aculeatus TaxID=69293 RepID=G3P337_GASAC
NNATSFYINTDTCYTVCTNNYTLIIIFRHDPKSKCCNNSSYGRERDHRGRTMVKSVMVAYALWAVGGPVGLHHLYLGRDSHALLWMLTLGGFGFGWVREAIRPRLYRLGLAWLAFSAPLGYCIFHNTTATLYYLSDCVSALLDIFWFLPWLKNVFEYILLMPYRLLCVLTGGGYYEDAWRKVLEILLKEYTAKEKEALKVLSLDAEASLEDITRTYRGLAKTWHPDHNPSKEAEAMFMKIHEAYVVLLQRHKPHRST